MRIILLSISISVILQGILATSQYAHDEIQEALVEEQSELEIDTIDSSSLRSLQDRSPRKMQITYDMSYYNTLDSNDPDIVRFKYYSERAIKIAITFFKDLITIVPKGAIKMKWDGPKEICGKVPIPLKDKEKGDKNSDLHLYIQYGNSTLSVKSTGCRFMKIIGPTHGYVEFSLQKLILLHGRNGSLHFSELVKLLIHELTHVLGFQSRQISEWVNELKQPHVNPTSVQVIRGLNITLLQTPHIRDFARQYYDCSNLPGMPLENLGFPRELVSHWDSTILNNDFLTSAVNSQSLIFSGFNIALLRDTGFYFSVNGDLEEESFYGRNKGCTFVTGECDNTLREYCSFTQKNICDYYDSYISTCKEKNNTASGCNQPKRYQHGGCSYKFNFQNQESIVERNGVSFGQYSRCFMSSLTKQSGEGEGRGEQVEEQAFCYNTKCNDQSEVVVYIGDQNVVCSLNNQIITIPNWSGSLRCPSNIEQFCRINKQCPTFCTNNGYCNNGICKCIEGFKGEDCSEQIE